MNNTDHYSKMKDISDRESELALQRNNARTLERLQKELAEKRKNEPISGTIGDIEDSFNKEDTDNKKGKSRKKVNNTKDEVVRNDGKYMRTRDWLLLLLMANVPIIGWIPLVYGIFAKRSSPDKVKFCKAMLIYQIIITFISFCIIYVGVQLIVILCEYFLKNIIGA